MFYRFVKEYSLLYINQNPVYLHMEGIQRLFTKQDDRVLLLALPILVVFFILAFSQVSNVELSDETLFHYPTAVNFYENGWDALFNNQYSAANTPLPYIIVALIGKLFPFSIALVRITTCLISFGTFYLAVRLLKLQNVHAYYAFAFLFYPYFFENAFVFYAVNFGLFFLMWGLLVLKKSNSINVYRNSLIAGLLFCFSVLCQQFYLVIPFAVTTSKGIQLIRERTWKKAAEWKTFFMASLLLFLPLIIPAWLFNKWGGLTHPKFAQHELLFNAPTIVAIFFVSGFYFFFYLLQELRKINKIDVLMALLISLIMVVFFRPKFSPLQGAGYFTGITLHIINDTGKLLSFLPFLIMTVLMAVGVVMLVHLVRCGVSAWEVMLLIMTFYLAITYVNNSQIGERHLLGMMILILLLILPKLKPLYAKFQISYVVAIGVGYFFYWNFFKF